MGKTLDQTDAARAGAGRASSGASAPSLDELRQANALAALAEDDLERLRASVTLRRVRAGEEVLPWRMAPAGVCFSLTARFFLTMMAPSGRQSVIQCVGPGDMFGEAVAIAGAPNVQGAYVCEESGAFIAISASELARHAQACAPLAYGLFRASARLTALQVERIYELSTLDLRHRLMAEILRLAQARDRCEGRVVIRPAPTHEALAAIVAGTREGVTRELKALASANLVSVRRREITVLDFEHMRAQLSARSGGPAGAELRSRK